MSVRSKITLTVIILTVILTIASSLIYIKFFSNYLIDQEELQISALKKSTESYLGEMLAKYQGTVNDYAHWDDTYNYMFKSDAYYINNNYIVDTFVNLDINFILLYTDDSTVYYEKYYDSKQRQFTVTSDLKARIAEYIQAPNATGDTSNIFKIGDRYYFIASSRVTDSLKGKQPKGQLVMGKLIDESVLKKMDTITGGNVILSTQKKSAYNTVNNMASSIEPDRSISLKLLRQSRNNDTMTLTYTIPDSTIGGSEVLITITKSRELYYSGINAVKKFAQYYSISLIIVVFILFFLTGKYISRPITRLISAVKNLDLTQNELQKLEVTGNDEFSFLSTSINAMLRTIEVEQYKVRESQEKLYATLSSVGDGVIAVDKDSLVTFMNPIAQQLTGWYGEESYGNTFDKVFTIINEYTREIVENPVDKVFETKQIIEMSNHTILISKDGVERPIEDTAAPIIDKNGSVIGVVIVFRDFGYKKEKRKEIEYLSYHDQLTGLYNRRFFEEELRRLDTHRNLPLSFLYADVNGLKTFNDAFGHTCGDMLIQQVADVFRKECRADDIIARTGGDEFIFLLPKTNSEFVGELVKRIRIVSEQTKIMDINISISFGWATKLNEDEYSWDVLKDAEDMMYQKKIFDSASKRSAVIKSILNTLYLKSPRENAHSKRVSVICEAIGMAYDLNDDEIKELRIAGELHDIGKIAVDDVILNKSGKLTKNEWIKIRRHPETGYRLLGTSSEYYNIAEFVLSHHERWDGKGYPNGLSGDAIHWKSRIIAIADAYDAMTCERAYRIALSKEEAIEEIRKNAGTQFDPDICKVFIEKVLNYV